MRLLLRLLFFSSTSFVRLSHPKILFGPFHAEICSAVTATEAKSIFSTVLFSLQSKCCNPLSSACKGCVEKENKKTSSPPVRTMAFCLPSKRVRSAFVCYLAGALIGLGVCLQAYSLRSDKWNATWFIPQILTVLGGLLLQFCRLQVFGSEGSSVFDDDDEGQLFFRRAILLVAFCGLVLGVALAIFIFGMRVDGAWILAASNGSCALGFLVIKFWRLVMRDRED